MTRVKGGSVFVDVIASFASKRTVIVVVTLSFFALIPSLHVTDNCRDARGIKIRSAPAQLARFDDGHKQHKVLV